MNYYLSIPIELRNHNIKNKLEKQFLRDAIISLKDSNNKPLLPNHIIFRKKEAFSDGVSSQKKSFFKQIQETILSNKNKIPEINNGCQEISGLELEKKYYLSIFDKFYPNCRGIIPKYWMPKFASTNDPSARLLDVYYQEQEETDLYPEMKRFTEGLISMPRYTE